eukprot:Hpha_TRINITY_DN16078_c3_g5::TRINITY_DN16078_c3_g5_i1::g.117715::m.117715
MWAFPAKKKPSLYLTSRVGVSRFGNGKTIALLMLEKSVILWGIPRSAAGNAIKGCWTAKVEGRAERPPSSGHVVTATSFQRGDLHRLCEARAISPAHYFWQEKAKTR